MVSGDSSPSLRRNGRVPSCEPCRKSKLACDHTRPVCRRCQARGKARECSYHPAPMTGMGKKARALRESAAGAPAQSRRGSAFLSPESSDFESRSEDVAVSRTARLSTVNGYLGNMSYLGPLTEGQRGVGEVESEPIEEVAAITNDAARVEDGLRVLRALWPLSQIDRVQIQSETEFCGVVPKAILTGIIQSIWTSFGHYRQQTPDEITLRSLATMISANTSKPLEMPGRRSMSEFVASFTGPNLRWEALGLLFSRMSLIEAPIGTEDFWYMNEKQHDFWKQVIDSANVCLGLCDALGSMNDLTFWLLCENCISLTVFHGDAAYTPWKRLGDLSSAVFALGLHLETNVTAEIPQWYAECRKYAVLFSYAADKTMACFVGRPPRINARYCALQLPLALNESQLQLPVDELDAEIARLGDDVYNTKSLTIHAAANSEVIPIMVHRERILELFLCRPQSQVNVESEVADIMRESSKEWEDRPEKFRYHPSIWSHQRSSHECFCMMMLHLNHVYNDFLIQRFRVQRMHAEADELLRISHRLLSDALIVLSVRPKAEYGWCDLPWILALYCLPPAGVLALELLRSVQTRTQTSKTIPKSQVIQNLSLLAGALDWVAKPGIGNYHLCQQARKMLRRILDKILDPPDETMTPNSNMTTSMMPNELTPEMNNEFQWLGATNAADELWNNLEEHSLLMFNPTNNYWP